MKYLGIDYGTKRIGIAISDDTGSLAFPRTTLEAGHGALGAIAALAKEESVGRIVIGESRDNQGQPNAVMEDIGQFKKDLEGLTSLACEYQSEFFSSTQAARQFAPDEQSRKKNPEHEQLDASAAAIILQSYLDKRKNVE